MFPLVTSGGNCIVPGRNTGFRQAGGIDPAFARASLERVASSRCQRAIELRRKGHGSCRRGRREPCAASAAICNAGRSCRVSALWYA